MHHDPGAFDMPSALITGVNRGIGLEFLRQYAAAGWELAGTCRQPAQAEAAQRVAAEHDGAVELHELDVTDPAAIIALAARLAERRFDLLLLNAGVMGARSKTLGELDAEDFLQVLSVNTVAPAMLAQAFRDHVAASEQRRIVVLSSILGSVASNERGGLYSYRASKAGVNAVVSSLARDLADAGVSCIAMHPGWVRTDMGGPDAALGTEEAVAGMIGVIEGLGPADSGRFLAWDGSELPW
jgi:NAD(P)-dependent dehydrogenase (short-subunit alcohol dehydrogenase family)